MIHNDFKDQLRWLTFLSLPAAQFELPVEHSNLARILTRKLNDGGQAIVYWATVPAYIPETGSHNQDQTENNGALTPWKNWNSFRLMCDQSSR